MNGKEAITQKILRDAEAEREQLLSEAQRKVDEIKRSDKIFLSEYDRRKQDEIAQNDISILSIRKSAAELALKKQLLTQKKKMIDTVFERAKQELLKSDDTAYLSLVKDIIFQYAEDGETVFIGEGDEERIDRAFVESIAQSKGIRLFYRTGGRFTGGVVLIGETSDKNITLDVLLKEYREKHEDRIAKILFGE